MKIPEFKDLQYNQQNDKSKMNPHIDSFFYAGQTDDQIRSTPITKRLSSTADKQDLQRSNKMGL